LVVATGFNSVPRYPEIPGEFQGLQMHTHVYRTPEPFAGRRVVAVGLGSSAAELACEISEVATSMTIAARSAASSAAASSRIANLYSQAGAFEGAARRRSADNRIRW
jgi:cation diffusion facilitator CzcD-associated flavoprotein CzcO